MSKRPNFMAMAKDVANRRGSARHLRRAEQAMAKKEKIHGRIRTHREAERTTINYTSSVNVNDSAESRSDTDAE